MGCRAWPALLASLLVPATAVARPAGLSIADTVVSGSPCRGRSATFLVTLSPSRGGPVNVDFATADGSAVSGRDYTATAGTLHFEPPATTATINVPVADALVPGPDRSFFVRLSNARPSKIVDGEAVATIRAPLAAGCGGCGTSCDSGDPCLTDVCDATRGCLHINTSAGPSQYCALAGEGITPAPDPKFSACHAGGEWLDSDGDGLSDAAEIAGYLDLNLNGVYDTGTDVALPQADPHVPDIYLHYDYVVAADHDHNPPPAAVRAVVEAFAAHGVNLHVDPRHNAIDESTARVVTLLATAPDYVPDPACAGPSARSMHQLRAAFPDVALLKPVYHYVVFAHWSSCDSVTHCVACPADPECGGGQPPSFGSIGSAEVDGDDAIVSLGPYLDASIAIPDETWAGVLMHELGHNLGLLHGGTDCDNQKPNYLSVMNYSFITTGIPVGAAPGAGVVQACATDADCGPVPVCPGPDCEAPPLCSLTTHQCTRVDYSSFRYQDLPEYSLDESTGLTGRPGSPDLTFWTTYGLDPRYAPANGAPIDWNRDGSIDVGVSWDINQDGAQTVLHGIDDWEISDGLLEWLNLKFQCTSHFGD